MGGAGEEKEAINIRKSLELVYIHVMQLGAVKCPESAVQLFSLPLLVSHMQMVPCLIRDTGAEVWREWKSFCHAFVRHLVLPFCCVASRCYSGTTNNYLIPSKFAASTVKVQHTEQCVPKHSTSC